MAIRIRKGKNGFIALCAAESKAKKGDIYLNDGMHKALGDKFYNDYIKMGYINYSETRNRNTKEEK